MPPRRGPDPPEARRSAQVSRNPHWRSIMLNDQVDHLPADPDATAATRVVYADLLAASKRTDHRLVIGQALRGWDFEHPVAEPIPALTQLGLPAPKLVE